MRCFDAYLAVDWSAASKPTPKKPSENAVWVGERVVVGDHKPIYPPESYFRTRHDCLVHLRDRLWEHKAAGRSVFLGFDFAYGYPAGFAQALGLQGHEPPWRLVWNELKRLIEDHADNPNNRFEVAALLNARCRSDPPGPFWGCPDRIRESNLSRYDSPYPYPVDAGLVLQRLRETERRLRGVRPTWQLWGAGAVGGQTLLGIPAVAGLRDDPDLAQISRVWPFETGFGLEPVPPGTPFILHAEIWPGVVQIPPECSRPIKDQAQVCAMVTWLADLDATDTLLPLFDRPAGLSDEEISRVRGKEGWIFGAGSIG